jgi:phosphoribosyl-ATP pyrophosphohydrolase/phosphoribosyl-AMP cyclohydrolase
MDLTRLHFDDRGLIPAVVQDWRDGTVLMVGYMNREALELTLVTKSVHFWSRSRNRLWEKGETSGHRLGLKDIFADCDRDTLLVKVEPIGPTCHTGERACFFTRLDGEDSEDSKSQAAWGGVVRRVYDTIQERKQSPQSGSYVSGLLAGGTDRMLKKVAEEAGEVLLASKNGKREEIIHEAADLLFHTLVVLGYHDVTPEDVYQELANRYGRSGLSRKKPSDAGEEGAGR